MKIEAAARLQASHLLEADAHDELSALYGLYQNRMKGKGKPSKMGQWQEVSWHLGNNRGKFLEFAVTYNTKTGEIALVYHGLLGDVKAKGTDAKKIQKDFERQANKWLNSGDASTEDRENLDKVLGKAAHHYDEDDEDELDRRGGGGRAGPASRRKGLGGRGRW
ncbi:hypothetical protein [Burkholderia phage BCSR5]|nr:hypothetical protein [Burkholderia phage BCSR5]